MIVDLNYELETIKAFFSRGMALADDISAEESARLALIKSPDEAFVEEILTHPQGADALEKIILRSVVGELNSLYEFALQQVWIRMNGLNVPGKETSADEIVFVANRNDIERRIDEACEADPELKAKVSYKSWPSRSAVLEVKELAEGFKHRHRLQPLPAYCYAQRRRNRATRIVSPTNGNNEVPIADYELKRERITQYIQAFDELLKYLESKHLLGFF